MPAFQRLLRGTATIPLFALFTYLGYAAHVGTLTTGVINLMLVLWIAFQLGFVEVAFASVSAVAFLDFFFMPPILSHYEQDPRDWAATAAFTAIAVYLSLMTDRLHKQSITPAIQASVTEAVFSVTNEGSYIAPEERRRIFERYYRSPEVQYKASGTGIGLSVTQKIMEAHAGRVWAESRPRAGTTLFLALPQQQTMEV